MLDIKINSEGKKFIVALEGDIDRTTAPNLESEVLPKIEGAEELVFDLAKLEYISSAGLRSFLKFQKRMDISGSMTMKNITAGVREIFELSGLDSFFSIE
ncbi:MAG: STAS domain-containing protein [Ruminococcus sp.]|nr:STAS domain-containing protein [Ruminococcus sp.]MBR6385926.1 STAS domain-containing protein [Ruminococcus sp.]